MVSLRVVLTVLLLGLGSTGFAWQPDRAEVVNKTALRIYQEFKSAYHRQAVRPKLFVVAKTIDVSDLSDAERGRIVDRLEELISRTAVVLDRKNLSEVEKESLFQVSGAVSDSDIQSLGQKFGASIILFLKFSETKVKSEQLTEQVTLMTNMTVIEVKTLRKSLIRNLATKYAVQDYQYSYPFADTAAYTLYATGVVGLLGSGYYYDLAGKAKDKYDKSTDASTASEQRRLSNEYSRNSALGLGAGIIAIGAGIWLQKGQDEQTYTRYRLISDEGESYGLEVAWGF